MSRKSKISELNLETIIDSNNESTNENKIINKPPKATKAKKEIKKQLSNELINKMINETIIETINETIIETINEMKQSNENKKESKTETKIKKESKLESKPTEIKTKEIKTKEIKPKKETKKNIKDSIEDNTTNEIKTKENKTKKETKKNIKDSVEDNTTKEIKTKEIKTKKETKKNIKDSIEEITTNDETKSNEVSKLIEDNNENKVISSNDIKLSEMKNTDIIDDFINDEIYQKFLLFKEKWELKVKEINEHNKKSVELELERDKYSKEMTNILEEYKFKNSNKFNILDSTNNNTTVDNIKITPIINENIINEKTKNITKYNESDNDTSSSDDEEKSIDLNIRSKIIKKSKPTTNSDSDDSESD
jgi:hypothetical protein